MKKNCVAKVDDSLCHFKAGRCAALVSHTGPYSSTTVDHHSILVAPASAIMDMSPCTASIIMRASVLMEKAVVSLQLASSEGNQEARDWLEQIYSTFIGTQFLRKTPLKS